jgi:Tol biopolymer transport system component
VWSPDSRKLAYVSARGTGQQLYVYDFGTNQESALTTGQAVDLSRCFHRTASPRVSAQPSRACASSI